MAEKKHLENAPITEALIDIRVKLSTNFDVAVFDSLNTKELSDYPLKEKQSEYSADLKVDKDKPSIKTRSKGVKGFIYKTKDNKNVVQFRRDGFTFNRLRPYTKWEEIISTAKRLWFIYAEYARPLEVTRIATRYINQIKLPLPINDFSKYMKAPPQNPLNVDTINGYLNRIKLFDQENQIGTNIIQTLEMGTEKGTITLLLDIDSYMNKNFQSDDPEIWNQFNKLRIKKNSVFFNSLTDEAINLHV